MVMVTWSSDNTCSFFSSARFVLKLSLAMRSKIEEMSIIMKTLPLDPKLGHLKLLLLTRDEERDRGGVYDGLFFVP